MNVFSSTIEQGEGYFITGPERSGKTLFVKNSLHCETYEMATAAAVQISFPCSASLVLVQRSTLDKLQNTSVGKISGISQLLSGLIEQFGSLRCELKNCEMQAHSRTTFCDTFFRNYRREQYQNGLVFGGYYPRLGPDDCKEEPLQSSVDALLRFLTSFHILGYHRFLINGCLWKLDDNFSIQFPIGSRAQGCRENIRENILAEACTTHGVVIVTDFLSAEAATRERFEEVYERTKTLGVPHILVLPRIDMPRLISVERDALIIGGIQPWCSKCKGTNGNIQKRWNGKTLEEFEHLSVQELKKLFGIGAKGTCAEEQNIVSEIERRVSLIDQVGLDQLNPSQLISHLSPFQKLFLLLIVYREFASDNLCFAFDGVFDSLGASDRILFCRQCREMILLGATVLVTKTGATSELQKIKFSSKVGSINSPNTCRKEDLDALLSTRTGLLLGVTGSAGTGKSKLLRELFEQTIARSKADARKNKSANVLLLTREEIRSSNSVFSFDESVHVSTLLFLEEEISREFALQSEARISLLGESHFRPTSATGKCRCCHGKGWFFKTSHRIGEEKIACGECLTTGYEKSVREVRYLGFSITDVWRFSVREALQVFSRHESITARLQTAIEFSLGHLCLRTSLSEISESERSDLSLLHLLFHTIENSVTMYVDDVLQGGDDVRLSQWGKRFQAITNQNGNKIVLVSNNKKLLDICDQIFVCG